MSESISACESLIRDFSWLPDALKFLANLIAGFGPVLALWGAVYLYFKKQEAERNAARDDRNALVAEETLIVVHDFDLALREIRQPMVQSERDSEGNKISQWYTRLRLMADREKYFAQLRKMEVRAKAFLGNEPVNNAIQELFAIWKELWAALDSLHRANEENPNPDLQTFYAGLRKVVWGSYSALDTFGSKQSAALETIQNELYPVVRLATAKKKL